MPLDQRRLDYLNAMGIRFWVPRIAVPFAPPMSASSLPEAIPAASEFPSVAHTPVAPIPDSHHTASIATTMTAELPPEPEEPLQPTPPAGLPEWEDLAARVANCTACPLHRGRTQTVFGVGDRQAQWMFIGEAPGEQEDLQGEPFVGRAGQLLNEMIRALGLGRESVYIANVLKCRPPKNRDPAPDEAAACEGYLKAQLALVQPRIIVAVGRIAAQNLLKTATPIGKLRGQVHNYQHIPLIVTYHPAYLLRSQTEKRRAWEDLKLALKTFRQQRQ